LDPKTRISFSDNLYFAVHTFATTYELPIPIDKSKHKWQEFIIATRIRNRLMHPNNVIDVEIVDDEIDNVNRVYVWFHEMINSFFNKY